MGHNSDLAVGVTSCSPEPSFSRFLSDTRIRRSCVKIPTDQRNLLGRYESWASFLSQRPNGFVNVPPDVLGQVKSAYALRSQGGRLSDNSIAEPAGGASDDDNDDDNVDDDDDDDEDRISWPASSNGANEANEASGARIPPSGRGREPSSPQFITQLPENSPPRPTVLTSQNKNRIMSEFPDSSQGPEDDLEVQVPAALTYNPMPVNRSALPMLATPPSAQVVPCTFEQPKAGKSNAACSKSAAVAKPRSRKAIYKPVPELYRPPKQNTASSHLHVNTVARDAPSGEEATDLGISSAGDTPPSIIPSTHDDRPGKGSGNVLNTHHNPGIADPPPPSAAGRIPPSSPAVASARPASPFSRYRATYPSYSGTILEFVTACMYIQLQYRKIKTCLYDDFIRAWVEGFLPYVQYCDLSRPRRKAMRAIDWYNEIDDDPQFTSRVVTRQNLASVLGSYPEEVRIARQALVLPAHQGSSPGPASGVGADRGVRESDYTPQAGACVPPVEATAPAKVSINSPAQSQSLAPSPSKAISMKRKSRDDSYSEGAERVSLRQTPSVVHDNNVRFDSGDSVFRYTSPRGGQVKKSDPESTGDAQEKRRRRLERHFKKKGLVGMRGIVGSPAPGSNGPPSTLQS